MDNLVVNQASTIVNEIMKQANIGGELATIDGSNFVSVGTTVLRSGYDTILNAVSQILSRTIFAVRPYAEKFGGIAIDTEKFGNMVRKLSIADSDFSDGEFDLPEDGQSVDMYKVKRANILQMNFYGQNNFMLQSPTIFKNQLDVAFSSPQELVRFWGMITQNASDTIAQAHENLRRATVANFIAGKVVSAEEGIAEESVVHLLTEYNAATGLALTAEMVKKPDNYPAFIKWVYGRIDGICSLMTERSELFHTNPTGKTIKRHTPKELQKVYILNPEASMISARVLADTYHPNFLTFPGYEAVNFWQDITKPSSIKATPAYLKLDGTIAKAEEKEISNVFGVIFDEEALGTTTINSYSLATPINAVGAYTNIFYHFTDRFYTDYTENGVVLLLD